MYSVETVLQYIKEVVAVVVNTVILWLAAFVVLLIIEAMTVSLTSVWFALGTFGAFIVALIARDMIWLQVVVFLVVTAVTLYFTRPIAKKYLNSRLNRTNADRVLDMTGIVREAIDNIAGTGTVYIGGKLWTARSERGEIIAVDTLVNVLRIEGVKLIVIPQMSTSEINEKSAV